MINTAISHLRQEADGRTFDLAAAQAGRAIAKRNAAQRGFRFVAFAPGAQPWQQLVLLDTVDKSIETFWPDGCYRVDRTPCSMDAFTTKE